LHGNSSANPLDTTFSDAAYRPRAVGITLPFKEIIDMKRPVEKSDVSVHRVVNDALAFVLPWEESSVESRRKIELKRLKVRIDSCIDSEQCKPAFVRSSRYHQNISIPLPGGHSVLVQLGALIPHRQKGGIRVKMNPARLKRGDVQHFHKIMRAIVGKDYRQLMANALLNVFHPAVDIFGVLLNRTLVHYTNAQLHTTFGKRVRKQCWVETYNYGGVHSDYVTTVYNKKIELVHRAVQRLIRAGRSAKENLKQHVVKQVHASRDLPEHIRVEVRGKKMRGLLVHKVAGMNNRFGRFRFTDLDRTPALPKQIERACISIYRDQGEKAVLETFAGSKYLPLIRRWLREGSATWWQPELLWEQAVTALRESRIFPPEAFLPPEQRREPKHQK
jgi:hypothetical protein